MSELIVRIGVDVLIVAVVSIGVGMLAPRMPARWLDADHVVLRPLPWESVDFYRGIGAPLLARKLPEAGALFGGQSKSALPGTDPDALVAYLREIRRAEYVHLASCASALLTFLVGPWWLACAFLLVVCGVNGLFLIVLRHNRLRIMRLLDRRSR